MTSDIQATIKINWTESKIVYSPDSMEPVRVCFGGRKEEPLHKGKYFLIACTVAWIQKNYSDYDLLQSSIEPTGKISVDLVHQWINQLTETPIQKMTLWTYWGRMKGKDRGSETLVDYFHVEQGSEAHPLAKKQKCGETLFSGDAKSGLLRVGSHLPTPIS